jgi:hypothetical protein
MRTSTADAVPDFTCCAFRFAIENLIDRKSIANALNYPKSIKKIGFTAGIGPYENVKVAKMEIDLPETLEIFYLDVINHGNLWPVARSASLSDCTISCPTALVKIQAPFQKGKVPGMGTLVLHR